MIEAFIYEGGAGVDTDNIIELEDFSQESIERAFTTWLGETWANETTDMYIGGDMTMLETITILNDSLAYATTCSCDGGMTYISRIVEDIV